MHRIPSQYIVREGNNAVPLIEGCTTETLYQLLEELGVNTTALKKKKATFQELEKAYYARLDEKLREFYGRSRSKKQPATG